MNAPLRTENHRTSPEGKRMGRQVARLCNVEAKKLITMGEWNEDERCKSCAFRRDTVPNGCIQTQLDVTKSLLEKEAFFCHAVETPGTKVCAGWFASMQALKKKPAVKCPWPYSPATPQTAEEAEQWEDKMIAGLSAFAPHATK